MVLNQLPHWCATCKISNLHDDNRPTIEQILKLRKEKDLSASIILVSCGAKEIGLRDHLKSIGFKKWPNMLNYGHASGKTWLMAYQIPKRFGAEKQVTMTKATGHYLMNSSNA